jgi:hypothetical protein
MTERKMFPRGTAIRPNTDPERLGLDYPPIQRVSLFHELLPFLGRGELAATINPKLAWYDERNLPAPGQDRAGAWVPELLVPYYPPSAWRATSPYAPDYVLGATNYVAIAGRGLGIARANPNDPAARTKVGITGYGWGSKPEEITDGLSNTIYMMQTPPGLQQAWIAGGGATVRGLDEKDPMAAFKYGTDGKASKEGTHALMGDGSVRWIPANIDPRVLLALGTRAGNDNADLGDFETVAPKIQPVKPPENKPPEVKKSPDPKLPEPKGADPKMPDPKAADPKMPDPKAADPKTPDPKAADPKMPDPKAGGGKDSPPPAPAPAEKK